MEHCCDCGTIAPLINIGGWAGHDQFCALIKMEHVWGSCQICATASVEGNQSRQSLQDGINATVVRAITEELQEAEDKAWDALGRYKFQMFEYWSAIWVHLNRIGGFHKPNPWSDLVKTAKAHTEQSA